MNSLFAPQTIFPKEERLKDRKYCINFAKHLKDHIKVIKRLVIKIIDCNNYHVHMGIPKWENYPFLKDLLIGVLYKELMPKNTLSCDNCRKDKCNIYPNICNIDNLEIIESWLCLLKKSLSEEPLIILGFEDKELEHIISDGTKIKLIKYPKSWYNLSNELNFFPDKIDIAIEVLQIKDNNTKIAYNFCFKEKFIETLRSKVVDDKSKNITLKAIFEILIKPNFGVELIRTKDGVIWRKYAGKSERIHFTLKDNQIVFENYFLGKNDDPLH